MNFTRCSLALALLSFCAAGCGGHVWRATHASTVTMANRQFPGVVSVRAEVAGGDPTCVAEHTRTYAHLCFTNLQPVTEDGLSSLMGSFFRGGVVDQGGATAVLRIVEIAQHENRGALFVDIAYQFELRDETRSVLAQFGRRIEGSRTIAFQHSDADMLITTVLEDVGTQLNASASGTTP